MALLKFSSTAISKFYEFSAPPIPQPQFFSRDGLVEKTRQRVLDYFGAPRGEYTVVFTANATGALKHIGECYPFAKGGRVLLTTDNHIPSMELGVCVGKRRYRRLRAADGSRSSHREDGLESLLII